MLPKKKLCYAAFHILTPALIACMILGRCESSSVTHLIEFCWINYTQ